MKIISWNINGINSWKEKCDCFKFLEKHNPDIFCVQEIKTSHEKLPEVLKEFPFHFYHFAEKNGYSGTAIFSKQKPISHNFGIENIDKEGRVITVEFSDFFLVNVYTPNSKMDLSRLDYRKEIWDVSFLKHLKNLSVDKKVIVCGDLNVLGSDLDLQHHEHFLENANFRKKVFGERIGLQNILDSGFVDSFRFLYPEKRKYSWLENFKLGLPHADVRLDYFLVTENLINNVIDSKIENCVGSDHLPIILEIENEFVRCKSDLLEKVFFPEAQQPSLF
ncbi:MAG: exodeoxyribonuclease III [Candidatus Moranbacteria bacterium]|nr:exodeoxyribonuclease III [Candidatus Moranbacteria bacterium]